MIESNRFGTQKAAVLTVEPILVPPILFIDGYCLLCCRAAQLIDRYDFQGRISVVSLQGKMACLLLQSQPQIKGWAAGSGMTRSLVWWSKDGRMRFGSSAVLAVAASLGGWFRLVLLLWLVPRPLRDALYRVVARRRHWFESIESCVFKIRQLGSQPLD